MYSDQQSRFREMVAQLGGIVIGFAAITIPFAIVVWPTTTACQAATGHTVCQVR